VEIPQQADKNFLETIHLFPASVFSTFHIDTDEFIDSASESNCSIVQIIALKGKVNKDIQMMNSSSL
jgi:methionyl-tRNA synthetase